MSKAPYRSAAKVESSGSGVISSLNSSTTLLTNGQTFTGTAELNNYPDVMVTIKTDQNGTFYMEFSPDGTNWDSSLSYKYDTSRINPPHILVKGNRYFRIRFTNDSGSDQTYLRLQVEYGFFQKLTASINGTLAENYDAIVTRPTNYHYEVAMGKRQGRATVNKWGYNLDVDTGGQEILAAFGGAFDPNTAIMSSAQTFTIAYNNTTDGLGQTGALSLLIDYLDENFELQTATHVLGNTGSDVTSFTGLGINRALVISNGGAGWNTNDITITATSDGTTQASIVALAAVTQQLIYHTPINHNLMTDWLTLNVLKLSGSSPTVVFRAFSWSRVTSTRYEVARFDVDSSVENNLEFRPSQPFVLGGREVFYITAETTNNDTQVQGRFSGLLERVS